MSEFCLPRRYVAGLVPSTREPAFEDRVSADVVMPGGR